MKKNNKDAVYDFDFLEIDLNLLDEEWLNQPKRFYESATQLADAEAEVEEIKLDISLQKDEIDTVRAELDLAIRKKHSHSSDKLTENAISNLIINKPDYQDEKKKMNKLQASLNEAKHKVGISRAAVSALDHRKSALERLVSLHGQNYFSSPKAPDKGGREITDKIEKQSVRSRGRKRRKHKDE